MSRAMREPRAQAAAFWDHPPLRQALDCRHFGQVLAAYRHHPDHGGPLSQETVARWLRLTQPQLSRIETGPPVQDLARLTDWARTLRIPASRLWFAPPAADNAHEGEDDEVYRRDILRLAGVAAAVAKVPSTAPHSGGATATALTETTAGLWRQFTSAPTKQALLPQVRDHMRITAGVLTDRTGPTRALLSTYAETLQLAGEIFFDARRYDDAAHAYALATSATEDPDRRACAMIRHGYVCLYTGRTGDALAILDAARRVAADGDPGLPTRHWAASVQSQAYAAAGDAHGCERARETAAEVVHLPAGPGLGWLRFDGTRLDEERGACQTRLRQYADATTTLTAVLDRRLSARRRGAVLADLIAAGAGRRDPDQVLTYAPEALTLAGESGAVASRLAAVRPALGHLRCDRRVARVAADISALTA